MEVAEGPGRFGEYRIEGLLGVGGLGCVYKAWLPEGGSAPVALKVAHDNSIARNTLWDEWCIGRKCLHPGIITHLAWVQDDNASGKYAISMEMGGIDLERVQRKTGPLSLPTLVEVGVQLAGALAHIHELKDTNGPLNAVHQDVKPGNVLLSPDGSVRLTDFGVATFRGQEHVPAETCIIRGTTLVMSPEQAQGFIMDGKSDVFSMGTLLYRLATGAWPFLGYSPEETMHLVAGCMEPAARRQRMETMERCCISLWPIIDWCHRATPHARPDARELESILRERQSQLPAQELSPREQLAKLYEAVQKNTA